ncbi:MAG: hypothetical protein NTU99_03635 [Pseudanabaena sp. LacPavin_0818_WC45_MAG_42_6]|nr:hypothetical protein [Pseudanabaena sp. LacPavin_0818_WC45_MAG_42_6]
MNHSKFFYLSFNGGKLLTIATDSTLTRTIAFNEVKDVTQLLLKN